MNPSTAMATVLVDELVRRGLRHLVLCPGSRSAPLAYAAQAAAREGRLTLHVRVDERSAGFLALGLAKLTRVPAAVVTTSGTAVANLHPAVLEAHHGVVPLIVLSADRPVELRGTGANQTTVQPGMFGGAVRWSVDAPAPVRQVGEVARWRLLAADAMRHATAGPATEGAHLDGPAGGSTVPGGQATGSSVGGGSEATRSGAVRAAEPGPVHLNLQLREPLVPTDGEPWLEPFVVAEDSGTVAGTEAARVDPPRQAQGVQRALRGVEEVARTVVVVGDLPEPDQFDKAVRWAVARGWPVVAEPFGTHPRTGVLPHGPLVLSDPGWLDRHAPDRVIAVGRLTLSRPVAALLRRPGVRVEAVAAHAWIESRPDIATVHPVTVLDEPAPGTAAAATLPSSDGASSGCAAGDRAWAARWQAAGERVARAVAERRHETGARQTTAEDGGSQEGGRQGGWPSGLAVAQTVLEGLPSDAVLFLGSSNTARDVDLAPPRTEPLRVVASRGLAGIDGCVSTSVGLALSGPGPTYALMGDLTFLHDSNGLLIGPLEHRPDLTIIVTNDDGGGIFTLLEPGEPERSRDFERIFATPTGVDLRALCHAHHVAHQRISSRQELLAAVAELPSGLRVLEVSLDRSGHRGQHAELRRTAAEALAAGS